MSWLLLALLVPSLRAAEPQRVELDIAQPDAKAARVEMPVIPQAGLGLPALPTAPAGLVETPALKAQPQTQAQPEASPRPVLGPAQASIGAVLPQAQSPSAPDKAQPGLGGQVEQGRVLFDEVKPSGPESSDPADAVEARNLINEELNQSPPSYRAALAKRGAPKVEVTGVLSREGSSAVVFEAELNGKKIAVKTYTGGPEEHVGGAIDYFRNEIKMAEGMHRALGPKGMAPAVFGEVDIGGNGNPSWGMEKIVGKDPYLMTAEDARRYITPAAMRQAAEGIGLLRAAGLGGGDSPQPLILTQDQLVSGVPRKAGDVVFVDPGGLTEDEKRWKSPFDEARSLAFARLRAETRSRAEPGTTLNDQYLSQEEHAKLLERAGALAKSVLPAAAPPAGLDAAFEAYLKQETSFGSRELTKQGVRRESMRGMLRNYMDETAISADSPKARALLAAYGFAEPPAPAAAPNPFPAGPPPSPAGADAASRPSGALSVRAASRDILVTVTLDGRPGRMEATFLAADGRGQGVAIKTAQYTGITGKPEREAKSALEKEARAIAAARAAAARPGFPGNVSLPEVVGLGYMDEGLALRIYGEKARVPVLLMKRSPGVTVESWFYGGKRLSYQDYKGLIQAVALLHENGIAHGDLNFGNILIQQDPVTGRQSFTLIDFGASRGKGAVDADMWADMKRHDLAALEEIAGGFKDKGTLEAGASRRTN
jgi:hypothetical protein